MSVVEPSGLSMTMRLSAIESGRMGVTRWSARTGCWLKVAPSMPVRKGL